MRYWYRVFAIGNTVGDTQAYTGSAGFPTMSVDSVSNTLPVMVGTPATAVPANPTLLTATVQAGPQVSLTWRDNATNETGFVVERCTGAGCTQLRPDRRAGTEKQHGQRNLRGYDGNGRQHLPLPGVGGERSRAVGCSYERNHRGRARDSGGTYQFHSIGRESQRQQLYGYADMGQPPPTQPTSRSSAPPTPRSRPA